MVVDAGVNKLSDGSWVEAGRVEDLTVKKTFVAFEHIYDTAPVVLC